MEKTDYAPGGNATAGQWGLSALLIGGLVVILFPIMVMSLFGAMVGAHSNGYLQSRDIDLGVLAAYVAVGGLIALSLFALLCGFIGLVTAFGRQQGKGLAVGGTVVALVAFVLAALLGVITQRCIDWALDYQKDQFSSVRTR